MSINYGLVHLLCAPPMVTSMQNNCCHLFVGTYVISSPKLKFPRHPFTPRGSGKTGLQKTYQSNTEPQAYDWMSLGIDDMCHGQKSPYWGWEKSHLLIGILIMGPYKPLLLG